MKFRCSSPGWPGPLLVPPGSPVGEDGVPMLPPVGDLLSGSREPLGNEGRARWPILDIINTWSKPQPEKNKDKKYWRSAKGQFYIDRYLGKVHGQTRKR